MNGKGTGIADVGDMADELQAVDELLTCLGGVRSLETEHNHGTALAFEVLEVLLVLRVILETGVLDPSDLGVLLEVLSHLQGVLAVTFHAQGKGLDALEEHPGVIRGDGGAEVAQGHGEHAELVRQGSESLREVVAPAKTAVGGVGGVVERVLAARPIEATLVNHDATDAGAVAANPLGKGGADDVRAVLEGLGQVGCREGAVHDEGKACIVGDLGDGLKIANLKRGVGHGLAEDSAGLVIDGLLEVFWVLGVDEGHGDAKGREDVVELGIGSTVQLIAAYDVVSGLSEVDNGVEDRGSSGGDREAGQGMATLKLSNTGLEDVRGWVHEAGVDVSKLLQGEEVGGVLGVLELFEEGNDEGREEKP